MSLYNRAASVVSPSVRLNFCANRFFSRANGRIATKLAVDGLQESVAQILGSPISRERLFVGSRR